MKDFFSLKGIFNTRGLVIMALMVAVSTVLSSLEIYITPTQRLFNFGYLPLAMAAMAFGPAAAVITAFAADFTSFLFNSQGYAYFPGYAVSAVVSNFLCAVCLYKRELTWWRVALWRLLVVALVIFGLNGLWDMMLYHRPATGFFTGVRLIRNVVQYPFDVFLVFFLGRYMRKFVSGTWK